MGIRMKGGHTVKTNGILTADDIAPTRDAKTYREWMRRIHKESRVCKLVMDGKLIREDPQGPPVPAEIEYGRWIVHCPDCKGCENVTPNDPIMFCFNCCNEENDFHVRPVTFPSKADQKNISAALMRRDHKDQYWRHHENAHDLDMQNVKLAKRGKLR